MKLKFIILSLVLLFQTNSFEQKIAFKKTIDENLNPGSYLFLGHDAYIRYYKVADNHVLRYDDLKIQLYDESFDRKWEIVFDRIKGGTKNYNKFCTTFSEDFIYIMQYNIAVYRPGGGDVQALLHKISYDGKIEQTIEFSEITPLVFVKGMKVINDELYVISNRSELTSGALASPKYDYFVTINRFNSDLKEVDDPYILPIYVQGTEISKFWYLDKLMQNENFIFRRFYEIEVDKEDVDCYEYLEIDSDFNTITRKNDSIDYSYHYYRQHNGYLKYDTLKYTININNRKAQVGDVSNTVSFVPSHEATIHISIGDKKSENIVSAMRRLVKKNLNHERRLSITGAFEDPINQRINLLVKFSLYDGITYLVILDEELKVVAIREFRIGDKMGSEYEIDVPYSFIYGNFKNDQIWGNKSDITHMNALEYSIESGEKGQVTVINYDTYQILLIDSKRNKSSTVYKVVR